MFKSVKTVLSIAAVTAALLVAFGGSATAIVIPNVQTQLSDTRLGAHSDLTVEMSFDYGATGTVSHSMNNPFVKNVQDPFTYPAGSDYRETVKSVVVDTPPGLVGNPNAVPFNERCDIDTFMTAVCPDSATVGRFRISSTLTGLLDEEAPTEPNAGYLSVYTSENLFAQGITRVSLLKTDPEVPALIGIYVLPPLSVGQPIRTVMEIAPDTNGDLRLRTVTPNGIDTLLRSPSAYGDVQVGDPIVWARINWMQLTFFGTLANGNAFMTNSTSCQKWETSIWASSTFNNSNADEAPLGADKGLFKKGNVTSVTPDCTNQTEVPFPIKGTVSISSDKRDYSPDFDFNIENPGVQANGQVSTSPRKIVARVPASINVDVQQLGRVCSREDFFADNCPASTKVGEVKIETPLIAAGLTGDTYLVKAIVGQGGLPDLGLRVRGAITFTQLGKNRYVGVRGNEIETTFDDIPQVGFSKLQFRILGGPNGLLRTLACPTSNKQPAPSAFSYTFTSYTGQTVTSTTNLNAANCFGIQKLKRFKCVYRVLRFQPTYTSRARIKRVVLKVRGKRIANGTKPYFGFKVPATKLKKLKKGKHNFEIAATYDDGTVSKKKSSFRKCR